MAKMAKSRSRTGLNIEALEAAETPADLPDIATAEGRATINLTVDRATKREFKTWCAQHDMKQIEAFRAGFLLLKQKYGT